MSKIGSTRYGQFYSNTNPITCSNCQCQGHTSKHCPQPITSYGVILFRINAVGWNQPAVLSSSERPSFTGLEAVFDCLEFLMIQRRDSIGFVEIMRGKYKLTDTEYVLKQFKGMTAEEREKLRYTPFETLWEDLWGSPAHTNTAYKHEKEIAKQKLEGLRSSTGPTLEEMFEQAGPPWLTPEWGFPKGRRDSYESEYKCAMRELWEETNIKEKDIIPIQGIEQISETFFGSNHVHYCHKYFIAYAPPSMAEKVDYTKAVAENKHVQREIGSLAWVKADDALRLIRPDNIEKKEILLRVCSLLRNYCPLQLAAV